jgi:hypothetical protein
MTTHDWAAMAGNDVTKTVATDVSHMYGVVTAAAPVGAMTYSSADLGMR